jgi:hypothetical protein
MLEVLAYASASPICLTASMKVQVPGQTGCSLRRLPPASVGRLEKVGRAI